MLNFTRIARFALTLALLFPSVHIKAGESSEDSFIKKILSPEAIISSLAVYGIISLSQKAWNEYFSSSIVPLQPGSPELAKHQKQLLNQMILPTLTFKSLAGTVPAELQECADFHHQQESLHARGIQIPHSLLLHGPAGCGKTALAYAFAGEIESCVIPISGMQLAGSYYDDGAKIIRQIFLESREIIKKKGCKKLTLIFDNIDFSSNLLSYHHTIHELIKQIKHLENEPIYIIATCKGFEKGDDVLKRFDRLVEIDLPSNSQRQALLSSFCTAVSCSPSINFRNLAVATKGFNCSDLKSIVQKASIYALRNDSHYVEEQHFKAIIEQEFGSKQSSDKENMIFTSEDASYKFSNLAGAISQDILEITNFIKNANEYVRIGARMPKGILLVGPPGCGKTSIARAIAGETGASFFSISGSQFVERYVGVGPQRIRELFKKARASVKSGPYKKALIFIDEIDAIGGKRYPVENGADAEFRNTLTELLNQMDGFSQDSSLFVIAATNRESDLDSALTRPGRFDRIIKIPLPDLKSRAAILRYYAAFIKSANEINYEKLAERTEGMSAAELENFINEAAILAVRESYTSVTQEHFEQILSRKQNEIQELNY